jgi:FlaA1/EpsC-like NDP-sugar epimerase
MDTDDSLASGFGGAAGAALRPRGGRLMRLRLLLIDALGITASLFLAAEVRFDGMIPEAELRNLTLALPAVVIGKLLALNLFQCDRWSFRYAGPSELRRLLAALSLGSLLAWAFTYLVGPAGTSRAALLLEPLFSLFILGAVRFGFRVLPEGFTAADRVSRPTHNVIIVGAGDAGVMTLREILKHPQSDMAVVGFIDDDPRKKGVWIEGVRVIGGREEIAAAVEALKVDELLIAIPSADGETMRELVAACRDLKTRFRLVPGLLSIIKGDVDYGRIRRLRPDDLLGRETTEVRPETFTEYVRGKRVMITGAGGTIGSELSRQMRAAGAELALIDHSETAVYMIRQELEAAGTAPLSTYIADLRDARRLERIFADEKPEIVFHAAAFKHVPLMEENVGEAVTTNVFGTRNLYDCACRHRVARFTFISTDKAVRPTSVMGATKRAAEILLRRATNARAGGPVVSAVRFGNVFGSSGSAPLLFQKQIESGGPVTVTHPHVVRFFMTVQEAVFLVIQASMLAGGCELFVLEMGQAIRILDLARNMITLAGLRPEIDIGIVYTGLRPGEKLYEEVLTDGEYVQPAGVPKVFRIARDEAPAPGFEDELAALARAAESDDEEEMRAILRRIVPEYKPQ